MHASSVRLAEVLQLNDYAVIKIMKDVSQKDERWKATEAWAPAEWQAEVALRASLRAAENAKQSAGQAVEANERSLLSVQSARMMRPPGLSSQTTTTLQSVAQHQYVKQQLQVVIQQPHVPAPARVETVDVSGGEHAQADVQAIREAITERMEAKWTMNYGFKNEKVLSMAAGDTSTREF